MPSYRTQVIAIDWWNYRPDVELFDFGRPPEAIRQGYVHAVKVRDSGQNCSSEPTNLRHHLYAYDHGDTYEFFFTAESLLTRSAIRQLDPEAFAAFTAELESTRYKATRHALKTLTGAIAQYINNDPPRAVEYRIWKSGERVAHYAGCDPSLLKILAKDPYRPRGPWLEVPPDGPCDWRTRARCVVEKPANPPSLLHDLAIRMLAEQQRYERVSVEILYEQFPPDQPTGTRP